MEQTILVRRVIGISAVALIAFFLGTRYGEHRATPSDYVSDVYNIGSSTAEAADFEPFWKAWNIINAKYAEHGTTTSPQEKVWGAIEGLANSLGDPYTVFLPPEESNFFEEMISGSFSGVGMEIGERENIITVIAPLKDTPAYRAGIRAGDMILEIDGTTTADLTVDEAVGRIRGEKGTTVAVTIFREGEEEPRTVSLTREIITIPTLKTEIRSDNVFVVSLYSFDANATKDFYQAMVAFDRSKSTKLLLDLRGNPGGFLDAAVDIASYFLPAGEVIVRERYDGNEEENVHRSEGHEFVARPFSIVVLVDKGSASASEILAGALKEHGVAHLVGEQTFGKGSVQELIPITSDTALKLTVAEWLTPNGVSLSQAGLTPDYMVTLSDEDIKEGRDPQLERAVALFDELR
ncbi:MAG: S41 family peptidase [Candidatus Pacebacteria bacterium]|nr:S41 family peptidase [Candidatus Paceibacterota bacterium]